MPGLILARHGQSRDNLGVAGGLSRGQLVETFQARRVGQRYAANRYAAVRIGALPEAFVPRG